MRSRQRLIQAMNRLLQNTEIENITVQILITSADVSRGTFYTYFSDKYDLMNTYFREATHTHMQGVLTDSWQLILTKGSKFFKDNQSYFTEAVKSKGQGSFLEFWRKDSRQNVAQGVLLRSKKNELSKHQEQAIDFFVAGYIQLTLNWIEGGMQQSPSELAAVIYEFMPQVIKQYLW